MVVVCLRLFVGIGRTQTLWRIVLQAELVQLKNEKWQMPEGKTSRVGCRSGSITYRFQCSI